MSAVKSAQRAGVKRVRTCQQVPRAARAVVSWWVRRSRRQVPQGVHPAPSSATAIALAAYTLPSAGSGK